jgi:WD40 repeat protein
MSMAENVENMADWLTSTPFGGHPGPIWAVAVAPDGEDIVTAGADGTARIWDRRSGQHRATLTGLTGRDLGGGGGP